MEEFIRPTVFLLAVILLARLSLPLSRRFHIPAVTIQLLIGILLGPSLGEHLWKITTGRGAMPSFEKDLTVEDRCHVVNYINTFRRHP
jgi:Kef-type K+ transport system membrane component KefB